MLRPRAPSLRVRVLLALSGLLLPHAASGVKQSTILNQRRLLLGRVLHAPADDTVALSDGRSLRREQAIGVDGAFAFEIPSVDNQTLTVTACNGVGLRVVIDSASPLVVRGLQIACAPSPESTVAAPARAQGTRRIPLRSLAGIFVPLALTFVCVGRSKRLRSSGRRLLHVPPTPTSPWLLSSFQADGRAQHTPIAQAAGEDTLLRRARMLEELRSGSAAVWVQTR